MRHCLDKLQVDKMDAAITTSTLLGSLSFADTTEDFQVPLRQRPVPFAWLGSQLGLGSLLSLFQFRASTQSMWLSIYGEVAATVLQLSDNRPGTDGIPAEIAILFDVTISSDCDHHDYLRVLRRLCRLLSVDPGNQMALLQYMQFSDGVPSQFISLLNALDKKALMLLSYWLALLCAQECWWSRVRARNDCWAICEHLEKYGDESMWNYMDFPAAACDYPYISAAPAGRHLVDWLRQSN